MGGAAKRKGTFEERRAKAIAEGRVKRNDHKVRALDRIKAQTVEAKAASRRELFALAFGLAPALRRSSKGVTILAPDRIEIRNGRASD